MAKSISWDVAKRYFPSLAILSLSISWALYNFATQVPFIQPEVLYQAYYWNFPVKSFGHTLFTPFFNDEFPGRFRYVEYLFEALYWKLAQLNFWPKTLYDLSAILVTAVLSNLLFKIGKRQGLSLFWRCVLISMLWLATPTFMVVTWHYRKAKFLTTIWLLLLFLIFQKRSNSVWAVMLFVIGSLTDPSFILLSPLLVLAFWFAERRTDILKVAGVGFLLSAIAVLLLNGVIGPRFSSEARLVFSIPGKPETFLNLLQWKYFWQIPIQIFGFVEPLEKKLVIGLSLCLFLGVWMAFSFFCHRKTSPAIFLFGLCLPVAAIIVHPTANRHCVYQSYYGHTVFVFFLLALGEGFARLQNLKRAYSVIAFLLCAILLWNHQVNRRAVFRYWKSVQFESVEAWKQYELSLRSLFVLRSRLAKEEVVLQVAPGLLERFHPREPRRYYSELKDPDQVNPLFHVMLRVWFREDLDSGRLRLEIG